MASSRSQVRVVIVEDHVLFAESLELALTVEGYDVRRLSVPTEPTSVASLSSAILRLRPRIVLLDFDLGRFGDGVRLVEPLAKVGTDVVVVTAATDESRWGQALSSVYVQRWLDTYLRGGPAAPLLDDSFTYLEHRGRGVWQPVTLQRDALLSERYCSAYDFAGHVDPDWTDLGCP